MNSHVINVVWFKRDFRTLDHAPLKHAIIDGKPILLIASLEPSVFALNEYSERHRSAILQSIHCVNEILLKKSSSNIYLFEMEMLDIFNLIQKDFVIEKVYSYQETGQQVTYSRDIEIAEYLRNNHITWIEFQNNGVIRGLKNRDSWSKRWYQFMNEDLDHPDLDKLITVDETENIKESTIDTYYPNVPFQQLGESSAKKTLASFLTKRGSNYSKHISKPEESRESCSRLSPFLAWGNLSIRTVYQELMKVYKVSPFKRSLSNFRSRLFWHCHFIQKFEMEPRYEFENLNRAFDQIRNEGDASILERWKYGRTGIPLVDACMRALIHTGYINFRMRSMLVSFLTHHLFQPWKPGAEWMASLFLDYEPGIHYCQFQMQAGSTGINTVRIYNPTKQAKDHDPEARFIKKWIPELKDLPAHLAIEPWKITPLEEEMYGFSLKNEYFEPIVEIDTAARNARQEIYRVRSMPKAKSENKRILRVHVRTK